MELRSDKIVTSSKGSKRKKPERNSGQIAKRNGETHVEGDFDKKKGRETRSEGEFLRFRSKPEATDAEEYITKIIRQKGKKSEYEESDTESIKEIKRVNKDIATLDTDTSANYAKWKDKAAEVIQAHEAWLQKHTLETPGDQPLTQLSKLRQLRGDTPKTLTDQYERMVNQLIHTSKKLIDTSQLLTDLAASEKPAQMGQRVNDCVQRLADVHALYKAYTVLNRIRQDFISYNSGAPLAEELQESQKQMTSLFGKLRGLAEQFKISEQDLEPLAGKEVNEIWKMIDDDKGRTDKEKYKRWLSAHIAILRQRANDALDDLYSLAGGRAIGQHKDLFIWIEMKPEGTIASQSKLTEEYRRLKNTLGVAEEKISSIRKNKSISDEERYQCFEDFVATMKKFDEEHQSLRKRWQEMGIEEEWVEEAKNLPKTVEKNSNKRTHQDGMSREIVKRSFETYYEPIVEPVPQEYWDGKGLDQLVKVGMIKGDVRDYIFVGMQPKTPDGKQRFQGIHLPFQVLISFKHECMLNIHANRVTDNEFRKTHFPKDIKEQSKLKGLPPGFDGALYPSELAAIAIPLAFDEYKKGLPESTESNVSPPPLREIIGCNIVYPGSVELLHGYGKLGTVTPFERGEKLFDLALATHYGRRVPFMQKDYPDVFGGDGEINRGAMYRGQNNKGKNNNKLYIKFSIE